MNETAESRKRKAESEAGPGMYGGVRVPHWMQYTHPWAMPVQQFDEMAAMVRAVDPQAHVAESPHARAARVASGLPTTTTRDDAEADFHGYRTLEGGVAVVDLIGVMTKYGGSFSDMPGGMVGLHRTLRNARDDGAVRGIALRIDSPGGSTFGTGETAELVARINKIKPVVAFGEGIVASAAYYVASQASRIVVTKDTLVGSIGVYLVVDDWSGYFAAAGVKRRVIKAGEMKGAGITGTEVTPDQLADFQRTVDQINEEFIGAVAKGRGLTGEQAKAVNDGRIHIASAAMQWKLIDAVGDIDAAAEEVRKIAGTKRSAPPARAGVMGARRESGASLKGRAMSEETMGAAPEKKPATIAELRKAFPKSTSEWREGMLELGASLPDAQGFWAEEVGKVNVELTGKLAAHEKRIGELEAELKAVKGAKAAAPGFAAVESGGTASVTGGEQQMIDEAVKAAGGNYRKGIEALQSKLMKPHVDRGMTRKAAAALCEAEHPAIFGVAA